ncbi:hypothetical protein THRCLA_02565 [Thraustotheca clavata]|uniref:Nucleotide-diphospho-sugar transferase domain-containing protein n=1 Tax=Thraustotheca clavata TaxID=74557 RepID=A0A1W0A4S7_9STRA|nr:hypothetical protein THRCLA_02565 [Thraustotheca clavata]
MPIGISLIHELRMRGNRNAIHVYHCLGELSAQSQRLLIDTDPLVLIFDPCTELVAEKNFTVELALDFRNFYLKPLALYHTKLKDTLIIDADCILFDDPTKLWQTEEYKSTGTLFFHDRVITTTSYLNGRHYYYAREESTLQELLRTWPYSDFDTTYNLSAYVLNSVSYNMRSDHEQDSSIVAIDKRRAKKPMEVLWRLITHQRFKTKYSWGDKENFWLAYELSHTPYSFSPHACAATGYVHENETRTVCGEIAQYFPTMDKIPKLLHVNGNALINPYRKTNPINGYSMALNSTRLDELLQHIPKYISPRSIRESTLNIPRDKSIPNECNYVDGAEYVPEDFKSHLQWRIQKTFDIASALDAFRQIYT